MGVWLKRGTERILGKNYFNIIMYENTFPDFPT